MNWDPGVSLPPLWGQKASFEVRRTPLLAGSFEGTSLFQLLPETSSLVLALPSGPAVFLLSSLV